MKITTDRRALLSLLLLAACQGVHGYSPADQQFATVAQTSFADAKLLDAIKGERLVLDSVLARELAVVRRLGIAQRDARLRTAVSGTGSATWDAFGAVVQQEIAYTVGSMEPTTLIDATANLPALQADMESYLDGYRIEKSKDDPELACPQSGKPPTESIALSFYASYGTACKTYLATRNSFDDAKGELGSTLNQVAAINAADAVRKATLKQLDADYTGAKKQYTDALARHDASASAEAAATLKKKLTDLDELKSGAGSLPKDFAGLDLAGPIAAIEKRQESVDKVLAALLHDDADPDKTPPDSTKSEIALLKWVPALEKDASATKYPEVSAMLIERESLRLRLEAAKQEHQNVLDRVSLLLLKRDALLLDLTYANKAKTALASARTSCSSKGSIVDAFKSASGSCSQNIAAALLFYANARTMGRQPAEEIDYRLIASQHAAVLDASENALAQWQSLIKIALDQLLAYHSSGIKTQDVAALLSALGLGAIAATAK